MQTTQPLFAALNEIVASIAGRPAEASTRGHRVSPERLDFIKKRLRQLPRGSHIDGQGRVTRMGTGPIREPATRDIRLRIEMARAIARAEHTLARCRK